MFNGWKVLKVVNKFGHVHIGTKNFAVAEGEIEDDVLLVNRANLIFHKVIVESCAWNDDFFSPFIVSTSGKNVIDLGVNSIFKLCKRQVKDNTIISVFSLYGLTGFNLNTIKNTFFIFDNK